MLTKSIQEALNRQIAHEADAANVYLAMASWCDKTGLQGAAKFLYVHADQERMHMMKLFHYVNEAGGHAHAPAVKAPSYDYESLTQVMNAVLKHEQQVTKSINELASLCLKEEDFSTFNFLQWYVAEQHEEERLFNQIIDMANIIGKEARGVFHLDKEIGKLASAAAMQA